MSQPLSISTPPHSSTLSTRHFSTKSIRLLANDISNLDPHAVDSVLETLADLDQQIAADFTSVHDNLADARAQAADATLHLEKERLLTSHLRAQLQQLQLQTKPSTSSPSSPSFSASCSSSPIPVQSSTVPIIHPTPTISSFPTSCDCRPQTTIDGDNDNDHTHRPKHLFISEEHASHCARRKALATADAATLADLLLAREDACTNQAVLVARLKDDHVRLAATYDALRARYAALRAMDSGGGLEGCTQEENKLTKEEENGLAIIQMDENNGAIVSTDVPHVQDEAVASQIQNQTGQDGGAASRLRLLSLRASRASRAAGELAEAAALRLARARASRPGDANACSAPSTLLGTEVGEYTLDGLSRIPVGGDGRSSVCAQVPDEYEHDAPTLDTYCIPFPGEVARHDDPSGVQDHVTERSEDEENGNGQRPGSTTDHLLRIMAIQQEAHDQLRATVRELTTELERVDPSLLADAQATRERLSRTEHHLAECLKQGVEKDARIFDLQRELKKVLAEYEAVSIAHSYSNAELSKIRANYRERVKKQDRQQLQTGGGAAAARAQGDRGGHRGKQGKPVLDGVENLLHHRKMHFR